MKRRCQHRLVHARHSWPRLLGRALRMEPTCTWHVAAFALLRRQSRQGAKRLVGKQTTEDNRAAGTRRFDRSIRAVQQPRIVGWIETGAREVASAIGGPPGVRHLQHLPARDLTKEAPGDDGDGAFRENCGRSCCPARSSARRLSTTQNANALRRSLRVRGFRGPTATRPRTHKSMSLLMNFRKTSPIQRARRGTTRLSTKSPITARSRSGRRTARERIPLSTVTRTLFKRSGARPQTHA